MGRKNSVLPPADSQSAYGPVDRNATGSMAQVYGAIPKGANMCSGYGSAYCSDICEGPEYCPVDGDEEQNYDANPCLTCKIRCMCHGSPEKEAEVRAWWQARSKRRGR